MEKQRDAYIVDAVEDVFVGFSMRVAHQDFDVRNLKRLWKKYEILKILNCCLPIYSGHPWQPFSWLKRIESSEDIVKAAV